MSSLSVSFIPPEQFATKRWWRPARSGAAWFYHSPAPFRGASFLKDYSTVDLELRPLIKLLHSMGLPTLPSCAGHWPPKKWTRRCFEALEADAQAIRTTGLRMLDVENGAGVDFNDPFWQLPWFSWEDMHEEITRYNGIGYVAFLLPPTHAMNYILRDLDVIGQAIRVDRELINGRLYAVLRLRTNSPMAQGACWTKVHQVLSKAR